MNVQELFSLAILFVIIVMFVVLFGVVTLYNLKAWKTNKKNIKKLYLLLFYFLSLLLLVGLIYWYEIINIYLAFFELFLCVYIIWFNFHVIKKGLEKGRYFFVHVFSFLMFVLMVFIVWEYFFYSDTVDLVFKFFTYLTMLAFYFEVIVFLENNK